MRYIKIQNKKWTMEIDLQGGRIVNLLYGDKCILRTFNRIDGKLGNTHVCVPNFAHEGVDKFGLPFHGPARNTIWKEEERSKNKEEGKIKITCFLPQIETYQADLLVTQTFEFHENSFIHKVKVEHKGGKSAPVNIGIHNYWNSPHGWDGALVNDKTITLQVKENGNIPLRKKNNVKLPNQLSILWELQGFSHAVVWSAFKGSEFDTNYVCIEPVRGIGEFFGSEKSKLKPKEKIDVSQKITVYSSFSTPRSLRTTSFL